MKSLSSLDLSENEIGDLGVAEIVHSAKSYGMLEYLDLSRNNIGKSSHSIECADAIHEYLADNRIIEHFKINWNNLRGQAAEKVIEGFLNCYSIRTICMNNNLLGVAYDGKQPPVCKMAEVI